MALCICIEYPQDRTNSSNIKRIRESYLRRTARGCMSFMSNIRRDVLITARALRYDEDAVIVTAGLFKCFLALGAVLYAMWMHNDTNADTNADVIAPFICWSFGVIIKSATTSVSLAFAPIIEETAPIWRVMDIVILLTSCALRALALARVAMSTHYAYNVMIYTIFVMTITGSLYAYDMYTENGDGDDYLYRGDHGQINHEWHSIHKSIITFCLYLLMTVGVALFNWNTQSMTASNWYIAGMILSIVLLFAASTRDYIDRRTNKITISCYFGYLCGILYLVFEWLFMLECTYFIY